MMFTSIVAVVYIISESCTIRCIVFPSVLTVWIYVHRYVDTGAGENT